MARFSIALKRAYEKVSPSDGSRVLVERHEPVETLLEYARSGPVAFVSGSREERFNNAVALREYLESRS